MLDAPRLLLPRALDPSYPRVPPPNASRFPPPLRERSRPPMRSGPAAPDLLPKSPPLDRLLMPASPRLPRPDPPTPLLARLPPCLPSCCRALVWRLDKESPRVVPPNLSAVARSRYGAPPLCSGLCCHLSPPLAGRVEGRFPKFPPRLPPPRSPRLPPPAIGFAGRLPILFRLPPPMFVLRLKLLLRLT
jgi:hypothetical protein